MTSVKLGALVRVKPGLCGAGYEFTVSYVGRNGSGETVVYGWSYGPARLSEIERVAVSL